MPYPLGHGGTDYSRAVIAVWRLTRALYGQTAAFLRLHVLRGTVCPGDIYCTLLISSDDVARTRYNYGTYHVALSCCVAYVLLSR